MEEYANMKTKCLRHKGLNHTEAGRGGEGDILEVDSK